MYCTYTVTGCLGIILVFFILTYLPLGENKTLVVLTHLSNIMYTPAKRLSHPDIICTYSDVDWMIIVSSRGSE